MNDQIIITEQDNTLVVENQTDQVVVVVETQQTVVEVSAQGPQGPQGLPGPSGSSLIGGYGVGLSGEIAGDVLGFNGSSWYNRRQETLSDGGNF